MKVRIVFTLLVIFAIWPLVHFGLVQHFQLNPWKYGGWAMYVVVDHYPVIRTTVQLEGEWHHLEVKQPGPSLTTELNHFLFNRKIQGSRLEPADLGQAFLEQVEGAQAVRIEVDDFKLTPDTARVHVSTYVYDYLR